ncbi:MAG TPA: kelch repeat-containing protein [Candidatus Deferrimicrobiaceae bacterium]|nr:kelch repeat-containing protein [Candidatus Deferrimicrobiaceae bacterium]
MSPAGSQPPGSTPTPAPSAGPAATATPAATRGPLPTGSWARLEPAGPSPAAREDHTWTVDEAGGHAYLFGGRDGGTVFADLWVYDLTADRWARIDAAGPAPDARFGHEAAWIPGRGLAVFAGQAGPRFFNDLWLFDPVARTWAKLPGSADAPVPRYGTCSGVGPDGRLWISHGFTEDGVRFSDTPAYDFTAESWSDEFAGSEVPVERCLHACWWTDDGQFALYGGQTTGVPALGDLWLLEPASPGSHRWREVAGDLPRPRQLAAVARLPGVTVVVGGRGLKGQPLDDAWQLVDGTATFVRLEADGRVPPARSGATLIHDPSGGRMLLFGGLAADERDDLWAFTWP